MRENSVSILSSDKLSPLNLVLWTASRCHHLSKLHVGMKSRWVFDGMFPGRTALLVFHVTLWCLLSVSSFGFILGDGKSRGSYVMLTFGVTYSVGREDDCGLRGGGGAV